MQVYCQFSVSGDESERPKIKAFADAFAKTLAAIDLGEDVKVKTETRATTIPTSIKRGRKPKQVEAVEEDEDADEDDEDEKLAKRKPAAKGKKKPVEEDEDDSDDEGDDEADTDEDDSDDEGDDEADADDEDEEGDDEADADDEDEEDEKPAKKAKAAPAAKGKSKGLTLDGDVVPACAEHSDRAGRPAVLKLLKTSFGVTNVRDLGESDYTKLIAALKKLPTKKKA
jgi:hypothetical protein